MMYSREILLLIFSYILGAIPFSLLIAKSKGVNLRDVGSGNLGATNVYRALGLPYGILVFVLDALKGWIPTLIAITIFEQPWIHIIVGMIAIFGHTLSPFVRFRGGKGAATGMGVLLAISPDVCGIVALVAVLGIGVTRYVAPTTIICSLIAPILLWLLNYPTSYVLFVTIASLFIIWRHRANIIRLFRGKEHRV